MLHCGQEQVRQRPPCTPRPKERGNHPEPAASNPRDIQRFKNRSKLTQPKMNIFFRSCKTEPRLEAEGRGGLPLHRRVLGRPACHRPRPGRRLRHGQLAHQGRLRVKGQGQPGGPGWGAGGSLRGEYDDGGLPATAVGRADCGDHAE